LLPEKAQGASVQITKEEELALFNRCLTTAVFFVVTAIWLSAAPQVSIAGVKSTNIRQPNGTNVLFQSTIDAQVYDYGAYGEIRGFITGKTYGGYYGRICTAARIQLWATIQTPSTLRPELNHGWSLVDVKVVAPRTNLFVYEKSVCNQNSYAAALAYNSTNPLRWSSSPWRVYQASAFISTFVQYWNGRNWVTVANLQDFQARGV
jgi:hypothetical protein